MDPITRLNAALEGRYRIESELGEGGMATVYLADDIKHERRVALKVLKPELAAVVGAERFLAEIKTTANLTHPHILPLFDSGEADSFLFYVMPHIEGESLRDRIDRENQLGVEDALALTRKIADALDYAHENGVVHRDIKPGNIRGDLHGLVHRKLMLPIQPLPQALPLHIRHHVKQERVRLARVEERQDMRMLEVRRRLDLGQEPLGSDDGSQLRLQDLERDLPLVLDVVREIDRRHPALTEF